MVLTRSQAGTFLFRTIQNKNTELHAKNNVKKFHDTDFMFDLTKQLICKEFTWETLGVKLSLEPALLWPEFHKLTEDIYYCLCAGQVSKMLCDIGSTLSLAGSSSTCWWNSRVDAFMYTMIIYLSDQEISIVKNTVFLKGRSGLSYTNIGDFILIFLNGQII